MNAEILKEIYYFGDNEPDHFIKALNINDRTYYFIGEEENYPVEITKIHIEEMFDHTDDENKLDDVEYALVFCC